MNVLIENIVPTARSTQHHVKVLISVDEEHLEMKVHGELKYYVIEETTDDS